MRANTKSYAGLAYALSHLAVLCIARPVQNHAAVRLQLAGSTPLKPITGLPRSLADASKDSGMPEFVAKSAASAEGPSVAEMGMAPPA